MDVSSLPSDSFNKFLAVLGLGMVVASVGWIANAENQLAVEEAQLEGRLIELEANKTTLDVEKRKAFDYLHRELGFHLLEAMAKKEGAKTPEEIAEMDKKHKELEATFKKNLETYTQNGKPLIDDLRSFNDRLNRESQQIFWAKVISLVGVVIATYGFIKWRYLQNIEDWKHTNDYDHWKATNPGVPIPVASWLASPLVRVGLCGAALLIAALVCYPGSLSRRIEADVITYNARRKSFWETFEPVLFEYLTPEQEEEWKKNRAGKDDKVERKKYDAQPERQREQVLVNVMEKLAVGDEAVKQHAPLFYATFHQSNKIDILRSRERNEKLLAVIACCVGTAGLALLILVYPLQGWAKKRRRALSPSQQPAIDQGEGEAASSE